MNYKKSKTYRMVRINYVSHYVEYTHEHIDDIDFLVGSLEMFIDNEDRDVFIFSDRLGNKTVINKKNICSFEFITNSDIN